MLNSELKEKLLGAKSLQEAKGIFGNSSDRNAERVYQEIESPNRM